MTTAQPYKRYSLFILILTICFDLLPVISFSQTKTVVSKSKATSLGAFGNLNPADYKYYFVGSSNKLAKSYNPTNNVNYLTDVASIIDSRTMQEINLWVDNNRGFQDNQQLQNGDFFTYGKPGFGSGVGMIGLFSATGQLRYFKESKISNNGGIAVTISPDLKKGVYFQNNDIWKADFSVLNGNFTNTTQLTHSGMFAGQGIWHLHGKTAICGTYLINLENGEIINLKEEYSFGFSTITDSMKGAFDFKDYISPTGRWLYLTNGETNENFNFVFDCDNFKVVPLGKFNVNRLYWTSENNLMVSTKVYNPNTNSQTPDKTIIMDVTNLATGFTNASEADVMFEEEGTIRYSPNRKYFLFNSAKNSGAGVFNSESLSFAKLDFRFFNSKKIFWVDEDHILFNQYEGQVKTADQGTYLCNFKNGEVKKITSYVIDSDESRYYWDKSSVVGLPEADIILFSANSFLFRCTFDGSNLRQITTQPNEILLYSTFRK